MHKKCQPLRGWHGYMFLIISSVYLTGAHHIVLFTTKRHIINQKKKALRAI